MLSEKRIRELGISSDAVRLAADEGYALGKEDGAAAERERLMEVVCAFCGKKEVDHVMNEYGIACPRGVPVGFFLESSFAEYLRLHPEAGEGG